MFPFEIESPNENYVPEYCTLVCCFKLSENEMSTYCNLQRAFGKEVMLTAHVFHLHKMISENRTNAEDEHCNKQPSIIRTDEKKQSE